MPYKECFVRVLVLNEIEKFIQRVLLSFVHECNKTAYFSLSPPPRFSLLGAGWQTVLVEKVIARALMGLTFIRSSRSLPHTGPVNSNSKRKKIYKKNNSFTHSTDFYLIYSGFKLWLLKKYRYTREVGNLYLSIEATQRNHAWNPMSILWCQMQLSYQRYQEKQFSLTSDFNALCDP